MLWELTLNQWIATFALICCCSFIGGWLADRILGYAGFSAIGNWLFLLAGAYTGLFAYNMYGHRIVWNSNFTMILTFGSALAMLMVMLAVKAAFRFR